MSTQKFFTLRQAAELLRVKPYRIHYLCTTGRIPEPYSIGGRRLWTLPELAEIADILKLDMAADLRRRGEA